MEHINKSPAEVDLGMWVGTLMRWDPKTEETSKPFEIYSNVEVFIGRDRRYCQYTLSEPYISGRHVRLYTIIFDEGHTEDVTPLIYAQDLSLNGTCWNNHQMRKGSRGNYLLRHGDILKLAPDLHIQFLSAILPPSNKFTPAQATEMNKFSDTYVITHCVLGSGAFGRVHMAYKTDSAHQLACKVLDLEGIKSRVMAEAQKSKFFQNHVQSLGSGSVKKARAPKEVERYIQGYIQRKIRWYEREASILADLSHPNIIQVEKIIRSENAIYIFSEILTGGDLFSFLAHNGGKLDEFTTTLVIRQVLLALEYLHERNIVHRDIKPDNILMGSATNAERVVLSDFGCAKHLNHPDQRITTRVGTLQYCAPELNMDNSDGYGRAADLWSLGCVMAVMLVGYTPFEDPYKELKTEMESLEKDLKNLAISVLARGFLSSLLIPDEELRMDTKEALTHLWLAAPSRERRLEAIYQNMLLEWEPRDIDTPVVVNIDNLDGDDTRAASISSTPEPEQIIAPPVYPSQSIDHVSETSFDETAIQHNLQLQSPISLSSPSNCNDLNPGPQQPKTQTHPKPPPTIPKATHKLIISADQLATIKRIPMEIPNPNSTTPLNPLAAPFQPQRNARTRLPMVRCPSPSQQDIGPPYETPGTIPKKGIYDIPREDEEEVYEEVCNPVTGKRKRLIYGQDEESVKKLFA